MEALNFDSDWSRAARAELFRDVRPTCVRFVVCAGRLVASAAEADVKNVAHMLGLQISIDKTVGLLDVDMRVEVSGETQAIERFCGWYEARRIDAH